MSLFGNISNSSEKGAEAGKEFVSKSFEYTKLKAFQLTTLSIGILTKLIIIGGLASLGFIFVAFSVAIALGRYFQNVALGYLAVGLIMLLISLLIYLIRKSFDKKIIRKMSKIFF